MLRLLERTIASLEDRLVLLAPEAAVPAAFRNVQVDAQRHRQLVREMQLLRGRVYLHDGAVQRHQLSPEGLHQTAEDEKSWHLLTLNHLKKVSGCAWYLKHENTVPPEALRVRSCPLTRVEEWGDKVWHALESELARARRDLLHYAEVGGWAVAKEARCTSEGLVLALAGFSLGTLCGGCLGITTATVRHYSSTILRRLGGARLEVDGSTVPPYYDSKYKCQMELLRFDSRQPNAKYRRLIGALTDKLAGVLVIAKPACGASREDRGDLDGAVMESA
jgi:hypothetical protein